MRPGWLNASYLCPAGAAADDVAKWPGTSNAPNSRCHSRVMRLCHRKAASARPSSMADSTSTMMFRNLVGHRSRHSWRPRRSKRSSHRFQFASISGGRASPKAKTLSTSWMRLLWDLIPPRFRNPRPKSSKRKERTAAWMASRRARATSCSARSALERRLFSATSLPERWSRSKSSRTLSSKRARRAWHANYLASASRRASAACANLCWSKSRARRSWRRTAWATWLSR